MNNTATLNRTEAGHASAQMVARLATIVAAMLLTVLVVSFKPFNTYFPAPGEQVGGDIVNQIGFGAIGALSIASLLCLTDPRRMMGLFTPVWIALMGLIFLSVLLVDPLDTGIRAYAFTVIAMFGVGAVVVLCKDADTLSTAFATMALVVLGMSYFGIVFLPGIAIHTADAIESEHAGLWRGLFTHKNIAGPVMAFLCFGGVYLLRRGWRGIGGAIVVLSAIFILHTGSKTTAGQVPLAILMVALPGLIGMRRLTVLLFLAALMVTTIATLGIVFIEPLRAYMTENFPDMTYTGRTALWSYIGEMLPQHPWRGFGFENFWGTPVVTEEIAPFDRDWDIRGIVNGHNGYLDIAITMGLPAMVMAILALVITPAIDYLRVPLKREAVYAADFFMTIVLFGSLNAFLETFFFRRSEPVWLLFLFGVLGLRFVARYPFPAKSL